MPFKRGLIPWNKIQSPPPEYVGIPDELEVVWAAGFWEGEGSLGSRMVSASQNSLWPLERLRKFWGGNISCRLSERINQQDCFTWTLCGERARVFIALIYPHLSPRRKVQINEKFITREKQQRIRQSQKPGMRVLALMRGRNSRGQFNSDPIEDKKSA